MERNVFLPAQASARAPSIAATAESDEAGRLGVEQQSVFAKELPFEKSTGPARVDFDSAALAYVSGDSSVLERRALLLAEAVDGGKLTRAELRVYRWVIRLIDRRGLARPTLELLSELTGYQQSTVYEHLSSIVAKGYLLRKAASGAHTKGRRAAAYTVPVRSGWTERLQDEGVAIDSAIRRLKAHRLGGDHRAVPLPGQSYPESGPTSGVKTPNRLGAKTPNRSGVKTPPSHLTFEETSRETSSVEASGEVEAVCARSLSTSNEVFDDSLEESAVVHLPGGQDHRRAPLDGELLAPVQGELAISSHGVDPTAIKRLVEKICGLHPCLSQRTATVLTDVIGCSVKWAHRPKKDFSSFEQWYLAACLSRLVERLEPPTEQRSNTLPISSAVSRLFQPNERVMGIPYRPLLGCEVNEIVARVRGCERLTRVDVKKVLERVASLEEFEAELERIGAECAADLERNRAERTVDPSVGALGAVVEGHACKVVAPGDEELAALAKRLNCGADVVVALWKRADAELHDSAWWRLPASERRRRVTSRAVALGEQHVEMCIDEPGGRGRRKLAVGLPRWLRDAALDLFDEGVLKRWSQDCWSADTDFSRKLEAELRRVLPVAEPMTAADIAIEEACRRATE